MKSIFSPYDFTRRLTEPLRDNVLHGTWLRECVFVSLSVYARLKFRILLSCFIGLSKVQSTFDQLANLHPDTLRDLALPRSNGIPMEIFRLAARNEKKEFYNFIISIL